MASLQVCNLLEDSGFSVAVEEIFLRDNNNSNAESDFEKTKPGKGALTSDHYRVNNIPDRFNNPDCFQGYGSKPTNPMYLTSAMEYGNRSPTVHTMPTSFHAKCQKFTEHLGQCGMYRNHSLNTSSDKSIV